MNIFLTMDNITTFLATIYVGIMGTFFNRFTVNLTGKFYSFLYRKTNLSLFKKMAEEAVKPYMNVLFFIGGITSFILSIEFIVKIIFGVDILGSFLMITWK